MNIPPRVKAYLVKVHHALEVVWKLQAGGELADAAAMLRRKNGSGFTVTGV